MKKQTKFELIGLAVTIAYGIIMTSLTEVDAPSGAIGMIMMWFYFMIREQGRKGDK